MNTSARSSKPKLASTSKKAPKRPAATTQAAPVKRTKAAPSRARISRDENATITTTYTTPRPKKFPPWTTLPFLILQEIFDYASIAENVTTWRNRIWLCQTALICRSFAEPAISILYRYPQTVPQQRLKKLRDAVQENPELGRMVRRVDTGFTYNIEQKAAKTDLMQLLKLCPNLKELYITDKISVPTSKTLSYPEELVSVLEEAGIRLKTWTWKGSLCEKFSKLLPDQLDLADIDDDNTEENFIPFEENLRFLQHFHESYDCFRTLVSLTLDGINEDHLYLPLIDHTESSVGTPFRRFEVMLARGILALKYLRHLSVNNCDHWTDYTLGLLSPLRLLTLEISNCHFNSGGLSTYLKGEGHDLRSLKLAQCTPLDLEFMSCLATATPRLEIFDFDSNDIKIWRSAYDDVGPPRTHLLSEIARTPTWPRSLQYIRMQSLSQWSSDECERFLQSLHEAGQGGQLPYLKELALWCILPELSWRDRASFREKWNETFEETFLDRESTAYLSKKRKSHDVKSVGKGVASSVNFRIDAATPAALQFHEEDFQEGGPVLAVRTNRFFTSQPRARVVHVPALEEEDAEFEADALADADPDGEDSAWDESD